MEINGSQSGKRILITGEGSYIGTSVQKYLKQYLWTESSEQKNQQEDAEAVHRARYRVDTVSLKGEDWKTYDFTPYDTVFHVAGIAHVDVEHVLEETRELYYRVNRDLAYETACLAKTQGVRQFIFMSSIIVYGESSGIGAKKQITADTPLSPAGFYADSKKQAEEKLLTLQSPEFQVAVVRAPMIYGKGSKGNYPLLSRLAAKLPVIPDIYNERSMLYVENLAEFVRLLAESGRGGIFFPQNAEYVTTATMLETISRVKGRHIRRSKLWNFPVRLVGMIPAKPGKLVRKAFGSLTVDQSLSAVDFGEYRIVSFEESIERTER